jgi:DNA-binding NarL/FixJ family response regulator
LVVVDDHEMVLQGLLAMLEYFPQDVELVGTAASIAEALDLIASSQPDVVLSDVRIGRESGLDLVEAVVRDHPDTKVVMLTVYEDEHFMFQALRAGAVGYLLKRVDGHELVRHLKNVAEGDVVIDPALAGRVAMSAAQAGSTDYWPGAHVGLTQRESEVLALLVQGLSNRGIASKLVVSEETVKTHVRGVYRKLGVPDRAGAVAVALREGMFQ